MSANNGQSYKSIDSFIRFLAKVLGLLYKYDNENDKSLNIHSTLRLATVQKGIDDYKYYLSNIPYYASHISKLSESECNRLKKVFEEEFTKETGIELTFDIDNMAIFVSNAVSMFMIINLMLPHKQSP